MGKGDATNAKFITTINSFTAETINSIVTNQSVITNFFILLLLLNKQLILKIF